LGNINLRFHGDFDVFLLELFPLLFGSSGTEMQEPNFFNHEKHERVEHKGEMKTGFTPSRKDAEF
jgi:hypothetical protein